MAMQARKRPRNESEDLRAECPFTVRIVDPNQKDAGKKKKRRRTEGSEEGEKVLLQMSPFAPTGKFKTHETMDLHYQIEPAKQWSEMTRYNSFVLNGVKYYSEGFVYVANEASLERGKAAANDPQAQTSPSDEGWVARILEIRASDEHHVYARVYWMYWPDELPAGTIDGKKVVQGRQPYHGYHELVASNHMDIINVVSVTRQAIVKQWFEENEDEIQNDLYWRQAFDVRTYELSSVELVCSCNTPANPDRLLVGCSSESCKKWLHQECILENALRQTWNRLGADRPHIPIKKEEEDDANESKRPLSPTETSAEVAMQQSIDVKSEGEPDAVHVKQGNGVEIKRGEEDVQAAPEDAVASDVPLKSEPDTSANPSSSSAPETKEEPSSGSTLVSRPSRAGSVNRGKRNARPRKSKGHDANSESARPWEGKFEATLKMPDIGAPLIEIHDLREGVKGGEKTWTEPVICLVCGAQVH